MSPQIRSVASSWQSGEPKSSSFSTTSSSLDGEKMKSWINRKVVYKTNPTFELVHFIRVKCVLISHRNFFFVNSIDVLLKKG